jgi:hypothetical protein
MRTSNVTGVHKFVPMPRSLPVHYWVMLAWFGCVAAFVILKVLFYLPSWMLGTEEPPKPVITETADARAADAEVTSRSYTRQSPVLPSHAAKSPPFEAKRATVEKEERERGSSPAPSPRSTPAVTPSALPALLLTIRAHESGGNYSAYNGAGCEGYGCYGAYQLHGRYMGGWATEAGHPEVAGTPATQWSPAVQDAVALHKFNATGGRLWCDWVTYC